MTWFLQGVRCKSGRADVGSEPSAASGRGSEVSEWPRSKFPAPAVRQRRNFGHRNRAIRNTPAQRSRRTDCHSQCGHWLRNDTFSRSAVGFFMVRRGGALPLPRAGKSAKRCRWQRKRAGFEEVPRLAATTVAGNRLARRWAREPRPYGWLQGVQWAGDRKGRPYEVPRGMCGLGIGPCGSFLTGREWYVSDFGGGG